MKITFSYPEKGGCSYYRMTMLGEHLEERGHQVKMGLIFSVDKQILSKAKEVVFDWDDIDRALLAEKAKQDNLSLRLPVNIADNTDILLVERPHHKEAIITVLKAKKNGIPVVVDLDDAMDCPPIYAPWFQTLRMGDNIWGHMTYAIQHCDGLIVSTQELAERYEHLNKHIYVWENVVDGKIWRPVPDAEKPDNLGFYGGTGHMGDIMQYASPVKQAILQNNWSMFLYGDMQFIPMFAQEGAEMDAQEWIDISSKPLDYAEVICSKFKIGIAPLINNIFNQGKSHLKPLEMMAAGVVVVASHINNYDRFIDNWKDGVLCKSEKDWLKTLNVLMRDRDKREMLVANGLKKAKLWTAEYRIEKYEAILDDVLTRCRSKI